MCAVTEHSSCRGMPSPPRTGSEVSVAPSSRSLYSVQATAAAVVLTGVCLCPDSSCTAACTSQSADRHTFTPETPTRFRWRDVNKYVLRPGNFCWFFIQSDLQPFVHTLTHRRRSRGIEPTTFRLAVNPALPPELLLPPWQTSGREFTFGSWSLCAVGGVC